MLRMRSYLSRLQVSSGVSPPTHSLVVQHMCKDSPPRRVASPDVIPALELQMSLYNSLHLNKLRNTERGHWINEAFVVRLHAVLECNGIVGSGTQRDDSFPGAKMVDLCGRLRNRIVHTQANVDTARARRLSDDMRSLFALADESKPAGKFDLSKDVVLRPMYQGCLEYSRELLRVQASRDH